MEEENTYEEEEEERDECPYLDKNDDCSVLGADKLDSSDRSNFCYSSVSCQDCPVYNDEPLLTDDVCRDLENLFDNTMWELGSMLGDAAEGIAAKAQCTGFMGLFEIYGDFERGMQNFSRYLTRSHEYRKMAKMSFEEKNAENLEDHLWSTICSIRVSFPPCASSNISTPAISTGDFYELYYALDYSRRDVAYLLSGTNTGGMDLDTYEKFAWPIEKKFNEIQQNVDGSLQFLQECIQEKGETFSSELRGAIEGAENFGKTPLDNASIRWEFPTEGE